MVDCAFEDCNNTFDPATASRGQKYCSTECTRRANNKRGIARYYKRKKMREDGEKRVCKSPGCKTFIRSTSLSNYCDPCQMRSELERRAEIRRRIIDGQA